MNVQVQLEPKQTYSRIGIILMGALGDIARGLAILKPLKMNFPDAKITWIVSKTWIPVVDLHPLIDDYLVFDRTFKGSLKLAKELKAKNFDLVLDLQRNFKSAVSSFFTFCPRRIGFHKKNSKEFNHLFNTESIKYFPETEPKLSNYMDFLRVLEIQTEEIDFGFDLDLNSYLDKFIMLERDNYIGVVLGSSWPSKDWFLNGYQQLIEIILERSNLQVVLLGAPNQKAIGDQLTQHFNNSKLINLAGGTNLKELVALLKYCKLAVGPDSGPGHLTAAFGKPYVSVFGPTAPERVAPYNCLDLVVRAEIACSPCWKRECPGLGRLCMRMVTGERVWFKIKSAIENLKDQYAK